MFYLVGLLDPQVPHSIWSNTEYTSPLIKEKSGIVTGETEKVK